MMQTSMCGPLRQAGALNWSLAKQIAGAPCIFSGHAAVRPAIAAAAATSDSETPPPAAASKKGRPRKERGDSPAAPKVQLSTAKPPRKKGRKREPEAIAGDFQEVNLEAIEEMKQTEAARRAQREAEGYSVEADEEDPRRYNFHRALLTNASQGLPEKCELLMQQMLDVQLIPGPRAFHVLLFAYVKAKQLDQAVMVMDRAMQAGVTPLPESYVVLMYALVNQEPPEVDKAVLLLHHMASMDADPQQGWLLLCKELFRKEQPEVAMWLASTGIQQDYEPDAELTRCVIEQLCEQGLKDAAWEQFTNMINRGERPGPQHFNPLIRVTAATGDLAGARSMIPAFLKDERVDPPNADSFNSLLAGVVDGINPETPEAYTDLEATFQRLRAEMLQAGLRPNKFTHKHCCEAFIKLRDVEQALNAYQAMLLAGGTSMLMDRKFLASHMIMLAEEDRPVDLLNLAQAMAADNNRIPKAAMMPLEAFGGRTIATAWLEKHMESMRIYRGSSRVKEAMDEELNKELRVVDGVTLGMGNAVVDADGIFIPPSKMTLLELKVELAEAGLPTERRRMELTKAVKERRAALPRAVRDMQDLSVAMRKKEQAAFSDDETDDEGESKKTPKAKAGKVKEFRLIEIREGEVQRIRTVRQSMASRGDSTSAMMGMDYEGEAEEEGNTLEDILADGVAEGVTGLVERTDAYDGRDLAEEGELEVDEYEERGPRKRSVDEDEDDGADEEEVAARTIDTAVAAELEDVEMDAQQLEQMSMTVFDTRVLNKSAGMMVEVQLASALQVIGGILSGPDYIAIVQGALAETSVVAADYISRNVHQLLTMQPPYSRAEVVEQYVLLARMCLQVDVDEPEVADVILARAEFRGLEIPGEVLAELDVALDGAPRTQYTDPDSDDNVFGMESDMPQPPLEGEDVAVPNALLPESIAAARGEDADNQEGASGNGEEEEVGEAEEEDEDDDETYGVPVWETRPRTFAGGTKDEPAAEEEGLGPNSDDNQEKLITAADYKALYGVMRDLELEEGEQEEDDGFTPETLYQAALEVEKDLVYLESVERAAGLLPELEETGDSREGGTGEEGEHGRPSPSSQQAEDETMATPGRNQRIQAAGVASHALSDDGDTEDEGAASSSSRKTAASKGVLHPGQQIHRQQDKGGNSQGAKTEASGVGSGASGSADKDDEDEEEDEGAQWPDMPDRDLQLVEALSNVNFEDEAEVKAFTERLLKGFGASSSYLDPQALEAKLAAAYDLDPEDPLYGDPDCPELKEVQIAMEAAFQEVEDEMEEGQDEVRASLLQALEADKAIEEAQLEAWEETQLGANDIKQAGPDQGDQAAARNESEGDENEDLDVSDRDLEFGGEGEQDEDEVDWGGELPGFDPAKEYVTDEDGMQLALALRQRYEYLVSVANKASVAEGPMYGNVFKDEQGHLVGEEGEPLYLAEEADYLDAQAEKAEDGEAVEDGKAEEGEAVGTGSGGKGTQAQD